MSISFNQIPSDIRTPGTYIEIDNSRALQGLNDFKTKILVIGQRRATGTIPALTKTLVSSAEQAKSFFGQGSMLANMFKALKDNGRYIETHAIALDDVTGGTAAAGTVTITGTATENGTIFLYVAGKLVKAPVKSGDAANAVASAIAAAINANADLPVTAAVSTNVVTVTYRHKGTVGNQVDMRLNYYGRAAGEKTPAGLTPALVQLTGGATDPTLQDALAVLPEEVFDFIVTPYTDPTSMTALENELSSRWGPTRILEGGAFLAVNKALGDLSTYGNGRNSQFASCMGFYNSPSPAYEWAAAMASRVGERASTDPARPYTGLELVGILPPPAADAFDLAERNILLYDGISTFRVTRDNKVVIDRVITMYQTSNVDTPDPSYLDFTTMATLSYLSQDARAFLNLTYIDAGYKIADDGTRIEPGQKITTPKLIRAELIGRALLWERAGLVENIDQFERELIVQRNIADKTRVDILMPPDLVNPLYVLAMQLQFRL